MTSGQPAIATHIQHSSLMSIIGPPYSHGRGGPGGWWIVIEPELHLGADVLVPDVGAWRRERMPRLPETAYFPLAPDWICEIVSPSTARLDRTKKLRVYAREGVQFAWIVDPLAETLEVLQLDNGKWTIVSTHGKMETIRAEPFDAVSFELGLLWDESISVLAGDQHHEGDEETSAPR